MLITFTSKYSPDILMFGDIASTLLKAMGQSATPPGLLRGQSIKSAADQLRRYLQTIPDLDEQVRVEDDNDEQADEPEEQAVGLNTRAKPLLDMLDKAYQEQTDVIWR